MKLNNYSFKKNFNNSEKLTENYSQAGQDLFVLMCLDGKKDGKFLDLGCYRPIEGGNNTYLLEKEFNWTGLSYDIDPIVTAEFATTRKALGICEDCTKLNWDKILEFSNHYDYLSLDLEPADVTYQCLETIPFNKVKFSVITYEHDYYRFGSEYKDKAYTLLTQQGYIRICNNIKYNGNIFEDWYINPSFINIDLLEYFKGIDNIEYVNILFKNDNNFVLLQKNRLDGKFIEALQYYKKCQEDRSFYKKNQEMIDYEMTILHYYVNSNKNEGLKFLINFMNQFNYYENNVWSNLKFYITSLKMQNDSIVKRLETLDINGFANSSPCKLIMKNGQTYTNIRQVNYQIKRDTGQYFYFNTDKHMSWENCLVNPVVTKNVCNNQILQEYNNTGLPQFKGTIKGIEDVRLFEKNNQIKFLATTRDYNGQSKNEICTGDYIPELNTIAINKVFVSPESQNCEKNWTMLNEDEIIYKWNPITIYSYETLEKLKEFNVPKIFKHFRGSSSCIDIDNFKYCLVHTVHYETPRKYLHWIVKLDQTGYPLAYSTPFDFEGERIEYALSMNLLKNGNLEFHYSIWDGASKSLEIPFTYFEDKFIEIKGE